MDPGLDGSSTHGDKVQSVNIIIAHAAKYSSENCKKNSIGKTK